MKKASEKLMGSGEEMKDFNQKNERRFELIQKKVDVGLTSEEENEFNTLQHEILEYTKKKYGWDALGHVSEFDKLPNGITVKRFHKADTDKQWVADIRIGPWYYCQGGSTKEEAVAALFHYMEKARKEWVETIKMYEERIETLDKFLATEAK